MPLHTLSPPVFIHRVAFFLKPEEVSMKIKAIQNFEGSLNGYEVVSFERGTILDVDDPIAKIFLDAGFCEYLSQKSKSNAD